MLVSIENPNIIWLEIFKFERNLGCFYPKIRWAPVRIAWGWMSEPPARYVTLNGFGLFGLNFSSLKITTIHGNSPNCASLLLIPVIRKWIPWALRRPQPLRGVSRGRFDRSASLFGFLQQSSQRSSQNWFCLCISNVHEIIFIEIEISLKQRNFGPCVRFTSIWRKYSRTFQVVWIVIMIWARIEKCCSFWKKK